MNFHPTRRSRDVKNLCSSVAADINVEALSYTTISGKDFPPVNLLNISRNISVDRLFTTSRCMAVVVVHMNKQMHAYISSEFCRTYSALIKSTPVTVKGGASKILSLGSGCGSGVAYGLPQCCLHMIHWRSSVFMYSRPLGIQ